MNMAHYHLSKITPEEARKLRVFMTYYMPAPIILNPEMTCLESCEVERLLTKVRGVLLCLENQKKEEAA